MTLLLAKIVGCCALLLTLNGATYADASYYSQDNHVEGIQSGVYNAGPLGGYAGLLSAGEAVSHLQAQKSYEGEAHDFGSNGGHGEVESLGTVGDHLEAKHFPADFGAEAEHGISAVAYEEAEPSATQQHGEIAEAGYEGYEQVEKADIHGGYDEYHGQPVVGIDHGKGSFSYSTLYEHKHDEQKGYEY